MQCRNHYLTAWSGGPEGAERGAGMALGVQGMVRTERGRTQAALLQGAPDPVHDDW